MDRYYAFDGYGDEFAPPKTPGFTDKDGYSFVDAWTGGNYSTPHESPYGFGLYLLRGKRKMFTGEGIDASYDDRLRSWHPERWKEAFGMGFLKPGFGCWEHSSMAGISKFLSHVFGYEVKCLQVMRGCNVGNGYPYFVFVTQKVEKAVDA